MKKIFGVLLCALMLSGCGGTNEVTTVCKGDLDMVTNGEVVIVSEDDKVNTMTTTVKYDYSDYVTDSAPISYYEDYIKDNSPDYESLKGVTSKMTTKDDVITFKIEIDFDEAEIDKLADEGILSGSSEGVDYISLKETVSNQEKGGLTCKEQ